VALGIMKRLLAVCAVSVLGVACTPDISEAEASNLARDAAPLFQLKASAGSLPPTSWPAAVVALKPEAVYLRAEGLYITTSSFFTNERGVFVLNPTAGFTPTQGSDPSYKPVGHGVFVYRVAG